MSNAKISRLDEVAEAVEALVFVATNSGSTEVKSNVLKALDAVNGYIFDGSGDDIGQAMAWTAHALVACTDISHVGSLLTAWAVLRDILRKNSLALGTTDLALLKEIAK